MDWKEPWQTNKNYPFQGRFLALSWSHHETLLRGLSALNSKSLSRFSEVRLSVFKSWLYHFFSATFSKLFNISDS